MHVAQAVPDLVGDHVTQSVADHLLGNRGRTDPRVGFARSGRTASCSAAFHVVVDIDRRRCISPLRGSTHEGPMALAMAIGA